MGRTTAVTNGVEGMSSKHVVEACRQPTPRDFTNAMSWLRLLMPSLA